MPVTKSATKKLRRDKRRTAHNDDVRALLRDTMRRVRKGTITTPEAYAVVDKTAKINLIHPNKAARLKSKIATVLPNPAKKKASVKSSASGK